MLAEFIAWWSAQMRALLPGQARGGIRRPDALIIAIDQLGEDQPQGALLLRRNGRESWLRPLTRQNGAMPPLPVFLHLPEGVVLSRDVSLPLAAGRDLRAVLGFEMDRLTPFGAEELFWGVSSITPDRARERLSLRLSIVPRAAVEALLAGLARLNLVPDFIETAGGRIALGAAPQGRRLRPRDGWIGLCVLLALGCITTPFLRQQAALNAAAAEIAARAPAAQRAETLRRQLAIASSSRMAIAKARQSGDALQVLAALTGALPDGTWLSDLSLKGGDLSMDGESNDAAKLIALLAAVPGLRSQASPRLSPAARMARLTSFPCTPRWRSEPECAFSAGWAARPGAGGWHNPGGAAAGLAGGGFPAHRLVSGPRCRIGAAAGPGRADGGAGAGTP